MGRKTAYEKTQKIKLVKTKNAKKIEKASIWQYLFENKNKAFTVIQLAQAFDTTDRKSHL